MMTTRPPAWAEALLTAILPPRQRACVSGDLLEEYRESIAAGRTRREATRWYVRQIVSLLIRAHATWAAICAAVFVGRALLDAFVPAHDFAARSALTTYGAMAVWLAAGFSYTWKTTRLRSALLGGFCTAVLACLINLATVGAVMVLILATNDTRALAGIRSSGGIGEMFLVPVIVLMPATLVATLGGTAARLVRRSRS